MSKIKLQWREQSSSMWPGDGCPVCFDVMLMDEPGLDVELDGRRVLLSVTDENAEKLAHDIMGAVPCDQSRRLGIDVDGVGRDASGETLTLAVTLGSGLEKYRRLVKMPRHEAAALVDSINKVFLDKSEVNTKESLAQTYLRVSGEYESFLEANPRKSFEKHMRLEVERMLKEMSE